MRLDELPDDVLVRVFAILLSHRLRHAVRCRSVCKRFKV
jgi:F-box-like